MRKFRAAALIAAWAGGAGWAHADTVSGSIVVKEGDALDGSTVASLNAPYTNGNGQVGFVAALDDGTRSVWFDTGSIWNSASALPDAITGAEGNMGISNAGNFIISPTFNGNDAVYGDAGLILEDTTAAPGLPGFDTTFHSRPQMDDLGNGYWIAGINDGAGGTSSQSRVMYKRDAGGTFSILLSSGDVIAGTGGLMIEASSGLDFDYHVSGDGTQFANTFNLNTGSTTNDSIVAINGTMVARETFATGQGDNWDNFDLVSINNAGNYIFSGDTDGATATDEFIAYNGNIVLREDDVIDGLTLGSAVNALSINNLGQSAFIWSTDEETETLFFASDASNAASAIKLLSVGDLFDADGNGTGDWVIDDFNASGIIGPGLSLAEDGWIFAEVDLESLDGLTNIEAIIRLRVPAPSTALALAVAGLAGVRRRR